MNKGHLFILIGLPRSGKSTFCNEWVSYRATIYKSGLLSDAITPPPVRGERKYGLIVDDMAGFEESDTNKFFKERELEQFFHMNYSNPRVVVCADDIRLAMGHRWNSNVEGFVHAVKDTMIKAHLLRGCDVLVDGTHTTPGSIKQMLMFDVDAKFVIIDTPPNICKERAKATGQEDLYSVIDRMAAQLHNIRESIISGELIAKLRAEVEQLKSYDRIV